MHTIIYKTYTIVRLLFICVDRAAHIWDQTPPEWWPKGVVFCSPKESHDGSDGNNYNTYH